MAKYALAKLADTASVTQTRSVVVLDSGTCTLQAELCREFLGVAVATQKVPPMLILF